MSGPIEYLCSTATIDLVDGGGSLNEMLYGARLLILDDPAPVEPPTAEQLAARRKFLDEHCDAGNLVLPPLHFHADDIFADLLKGGGQ